MYKLIPIPPCYVLEAKSFLQLNSKWHKNSILILILIITIIINKKVYIIWNISLPSPFGFLYLN